VDKLIAVLEQRISQIYEILHEGGNPSPAERYRLEGLMEAAEIMGLLSRQEIWTKVESAYHRVYQADLIDSYGQSWQDCFSFPSIPLNGIRAPVYPAKTE